MASTPRSRRGGNDGARDASSPRRRLVARAIVVVVAVASVGAGAVVARSYWRLNAWLDEGGRWLAPLEVVLVDDGRRVVEGVALTGPLGDDAPAPTLDAMILRSQTRDRHVRHLSRSEPFPGLLRRVWYVKVYMETELVGSVDGTVEGAEEEAGGGNGLAVTRPIVFAIRYRIGRDGFRMLGTDTLGI